MESGKSDVSSIMLEDILENLKKSNRDTILVKKAKKNLHEFVYYDSRLCKTYGAHSFLLFRDSLDSYRSLREEMIFICWCLEINTNITHYAIELMDELFTSLVENSLKNGFMKTLPYNTELSKNFGVNIAFLKKMNMHFGSLYLQLGDNLKMCNYGRLIAMVMCIFIASKQNDYTHLKLAKFRNYLSAKLVPNELLIRKELLAVEAKILSMLNFDLPLTTLKDYLETLLFALVRDMKKFNGKVFTSYFSEQNVSAILDVSLTIIENYYMRQIPFLYKLFNTFRKRPFNAFSLDDIEEFENLHRDKIYIASIILAAACTLVNSQYSNTYILSHIAMLISSEQEAIDLGCESVLNSLLFTDLVIKTTSNY